MYWAVTCRLLLLHTSNKQALQINFFQFVYTHSSHIWIDRTLFGFVPQCPRRMKLTMTLPPPPASTTASGASHPPAPPPAFQELPPVHLHQHYPISSQGWQRTCTTFLLIPWRSTNDKSLHILCGVSIGVVLVLFFSNKWQISHSLVWFDLC